jgi:5-hydroxyisourate hydrolase-like protein (transthyretin family)
MIRKQHHLICISLLILSCSQITAESNATIYGFVTDQNTGEPFKEVKVEIFYSTDHSTPIATLTTDSKGFYNTTVSENRNYDIYVRLGKTNPMQTTYVGEGYVQQVDFKIGMKSVGGENITEEGGFWIVVAVAVVILGVILVDQLYLRKKRVMRELEVERKRLEEKLEDKIEGSEDELTTLKKERDRIDYMINLTKTKFHKRKLDEESFREIVRDYQKRLIEIETRIKELEGG